MYNLLSNLTVTNFNNIIIDKIDSKSIEATIWIESNYLGSFPP